MSRSAEIYNPPECEYPQSHATARDIKTELQGVAGNHSNCTSMYLDTVEGMSNDVLSTEGEDHHQGLARTHKLSDSSIYWFLSHSETDKGDKGDKGSLSQYRYRGSTQGEHILQTSPLTVAPMRQNLLINEQHPSDIVFMPDVDGHDSGYLFVTEEYVHHRLAIYRWEAGQDLVLHGHLRQGFPAGGYLGVASSNWGWGKLFTARDRDLFPRCEKGALDVDAFRAVTPESWFPFHMTGGASQNKLVRDVTGKWFLLGFRSDSSDDPNGTDYVDVYQVTFAPFRISYRLHSVHIAFRPGDTGFASTGTHHVEPSGRLLVSSSYRWSKDEGPGGSSFVSRVDECPSS